MKHQEGGGEAQASLSRAQNFRDAGPKEESWGQMEGGGLTKEVWAAWGVRQGRNVWGDGERAEPGRSGSLWEPTVSGLKPVLRNIHLQGQSLPESQKMYRCHWLLVVGW